jgi:hypothetical protein
MGLPAAHFRPVLSRRVGGRRRCRMHDETMPALIPDPSKPIVFSELAGHIFALASSVVLAFLSYYVFGIIGVLFVGCTTTIAAMTVPWSVSATSDVVTLRYVARPATLLGSSETIIAVAKRKHRIVVSVQNPTLWRRRVVVSFRYSNDDG